MRWNDLPGTRIGPYVIVDELGRGGSARVFRAMQEPQQRYVAIKIMVNDADDQLSFVRRFEREVELVAQLSHPNIVAVYDSGQHQDLLYLVMQYVGGGTLRQRFGQPLPVDVACAAMAQMGHALHHAHLHGIVHRDVKPSNMLVSTESPGQILLTDFGIAKLRGLRGLTKSGTTIGTPEYMAPEQAEGREVDGRADVYSLGCVLFEALAGRPPFTGSTPVSVLYQQVHARPDYIRGLNSEVPRELARIIDIALAKRPEDRFVSAESFAQALRAYAGHAGHAGRAARSTREATPLPAGSRAAQTAQTGQGAASDTTGLPARDPAAAPAPADASAQIVSKRVYADERGGALDERAPVGSGPVGDWGASGLDDLFPELPTQPHSASAQPGAPEHTVAMTDNEHWHADDVAYARPPLASGPVSGPRPTVPLAPLRATRGVPSAPLPTDSPDVPTPQPRVERPHRDSGRLADLPSAAAIASAMPTDTTPPPAPLRTLAAASPNATHDAERPAPALPPSGPPGAQGRRQGRSGIRRSARPVLLAAMVLLLAVVATGALASILTHGAPLAWLPHGAPATATPPPTTSTATPAASPTTEPVATATPTHQQVLDQQAGAAFRAVTLGTFADQSCASTNARTSFAASQSIFVNLCTANSAAYGHITILLRQNGAATFVITRDAQVSAGQWYSFYTYNVNPGAYDILVTYNGGTAADLSLTIH